MQAMEWSGVNKQKKCPINSQSLKTTTLPESRGQNKMAYHVLINYPPLSFAKGTND
jgi:hypothetical protein